MSERTDRDWVLALRLATGGGMVTTTKVAVSLRVAASLLGVHYRTLKRYAARGRLPTYWSGNTEMVTMETVARIQRGELTLRPPTERPHTWQQRDEQGRFVRKDGHDERPDETGDGTHSLQRPDGQRARGAGG